MGKPVTGRALVIACLIAGLLGAGAAVGVSYLFVTPKPVARSISNVSGSVDDVSSTVDDLSSTVSNVCDQFTSITC